MVELTDQMRMLCLGAMSIIAFPFGFLCGWKIHKYNELEKAERRQMVSTIIKPDPDATSKANKELSDVIKSLVGDDLIIEK